jgi:hypothetical protein
LRRAGRGGPRHGRRTDRHHGTEQDAAIVGVHADANRRAAAAEADRDQALARAEQASQIAQ